MDENTTSFVIKALALIRAAIVLTSWLSFFASVWLFIYFGDIRYFGAFVFWGLLTLIIWFGAYSKK